VWRWLAAASLLAALTPAAARPRYGGTLRVEIQAAPQALDPADALLGPLVGPFRLVRWEPGRSAQFEASEDHPAGRPFLDAVDLQMGRPLREQLLDLELGRADIVEIAVDESRRAAQRGVRVWASKPAVLLALVATVDDPRLREALALSIDRMAIHSVLLQRQGDPAGALLPNWLSGWAWLFSSTPDLARARRLVAELRPPPLLLSYEPSDAVVAERLILNLRDAGLAVRAAPGAARAELRLARRRIPVLPPARALPLLAVALGLREGSPASEEDAYLYERALVDEHRVIPVVHLPDLYGLSRRVRDWNPDRWDDIWLERDRP
jgi:hypothetical protein